MASYSNTKATSSFRKNTIGNKQINSLKTNNTTSINREQQLQKKSSYRLYWVPCWIFPTYKWNAFVRENNYIVWRPYHVFNLDNEAPSFHFCASFSNSFFLSLVFGLLIHLSPCFYFHSSPLTPTCNYRMSKAIQGEALLRHTIIQIYTARKI